MYLLKRLIQPPRNDPGNGDSGAEEGSKDKPRMGFSIEQGRRPYQEDTMSSTMSMPTAGGDAAFFGMFDGHGGVKAAAWAKDNLSKNVALALAKTTQPETALVMAFKKTDAEFLAHARRENLFDGCTATSALLIGRELYVANAGDSRTVICRGTRGTPLSDDHKPDKPSERRRIEHAGGTVTFFGCARVNGVLATSRGFGDQELKQWVTAEPEVKKRILDEGDEFLVLATDGLWDVLSNDDAARIISGEKSVQGAAKKLTSEALRLGTMDNVSAIVLDLRALVAGMGKAEKKDSLRSPSLKSASFNGRFAQGAVVGEEGGSPTRLAHRTQQKGVHNSPIVGGLPAMSPGGGGKAAGTNPAQSPGWARTRAGPPASDRNPDASKRPFEGTDALLLGMTPLANGSHGQSPVARVAAASTRRGANTEAAAGGRGAPILDGSPARGPRARVAGVSPPHDATGGIAAFRRKSSGISRVGSIGAESQASVLKRVKETHAIKSKSFSTVESAKADAARSKDPKPGLHL